MRLDIKRMLINIACFMILVYPFNYTIKSRIFPNSSIMFIIIIISFIILFIFSKLRKITKSQFITLIITLIVIFFELYRNHYLKEEIEGKVLFFTIYLFLPFIVMSNEYVIIPFFKIIAFFCIEHILGTFFVQFFKDQYINTILPWLSLGQDNVAYVNIMNGYNPGLTLHYSTNGIYLSIATILFFCKYIKDSRKKDFILTTLALMALLLTGKRAHTLFVIITCITIYIFHCRERISSKFIKLFVIIILGIVGIMCLSTVMPQILNVMTRFETTIAKGEMLSGREPFYELAWKLWEKDKFFGLGWGAFSYYFQIYLYGPEFTYDYLDAHNVYLQILCECGIIGFIFFISIAIYVFLNCWSCVKKIKRNEMYFYLLFSFGFQMFFLLYCFSGNPLYDIQCYSIYFLAIGITLQYKNFLRVKIGESNEKSNSNSTSI